MNYSNLVTVNPNQLQKVGRLLSSAKVPLEHEGIDHGFEWAGTADELGNAYLAIVGICHQTSPLGERHLEGRINGVPKRGWDYLKQKFLISANDLKELTTPEYWMWMTTQQLASLYHDPGYGLTLNRINERCMLLNDLGRKLSSDGFTVVREAFDAVGRTVGGPSGFLNYLHEFQAYTDPVFKKSMFFLSIAAKECGWSVKDPDNLFSPIDYHELRGHLRLGTMRIVDGDLSNKVKRGLPITEAEDYALRSVAQEANRLIADATGFSNSVLHYLLWNVFRNCCPRDSRETHCSSCPNTCQLPMHYKDMAVYEGKCIFAELCPSANQPAKIIDPPYVGHYY